MIHVKNLTFTVGSFSLRGVTLDVADGEYFVLLGPTGSGKTLFIESLCGLLRPDGGTIEIGGRDVTHDPPRLRQVGYVPQHSALFPHLRVRQNIAFALKSRRVPRREWRERLEPLNDMLGLSPLLDRWPAHLSGGERQKVALARALASRPSLLILDEPVSSMDEPTRERLCTELRHIQRELAVTTLHISHNVEEALSVADRAGVFRDGRFVQIGPIAELLRRPSTEFVARFFRAENIIQTTATPRSGQMSELRLGDHSLLVDGAWKGAVTFVVRPETIGVRAGGAAGGAIPAILERVTDRGAYRRLEFDAGLRLVAYSIQDAQTLLPAIGRPHALEIPPHAVHILPGAAGDAEC
ncbi:ABC transporter ATP-binding protein [bacterium]|nr:ABC transporter ATP-binding protein [bacterium]